MRIKVLRAGREVGFESTEGYIAGQLCDLPAEAVAIQEKLGNVVRVDDQGNPVSIIPDLPYVTRQGTSSFTTSGRMYYESFRKQLNRDEEKIKTKVDERETAALDEIGRLALLKLGLSIPLDTFRNRFKGDTRANTGSFTSPIIEKVKAVIDEYVYESSKTIMSSEIYNLRNAAFESKPTNKGQSRRGVKGFQKKITAEDEAVKAEVEEE